VKRLPNKQGWVCEARTGEASSSGPGTKKLTSMPLFHQCAAQCATPSHTLDM
jgi:hypothetical protein